MAPHRIEGTFPENFIWGAGTGGYQVEGHETHSDLTAVLDCDPAVLGFREHVGIAADHLNRYPSDIALLAEAGLNCYRFSVEWSRVEPEKGQFSKRWLDHYAAVAQCCRDLGLRPMITLHHFMSPLWFALEGGFDQDAAPALFARYCAVVAEHLGTDVVSYSTINEVNMLPAILPTDSRSAMEAVRKALAVRYDTSHFSMVMAQDGRTANNLKLSHLRAVEAIRRAAPGAKVGATYSVSHYRTLPGGGEKMLELRREAQDSFFPVSRGDDFLGVQTYKPIYVDATGEVPPGDDVEQTQMGWEYDPTSLGGAVRHAWEQTGVPVVVTEHGIATADDARRIAFVRDSLASMKQAMDEGCVVHGYVHWSALDNWEWLEGYRPTFGLIGIDRATLERHPKPSLAWLGQVAAANRLVAEARA